MGVLGRQGQAPGRDTRGPGWLHLCAQLGALGWNRSAEVFVQTSFFFSFLFLTKTTSDSSPAVLPPSLPCLFSFCPHPFWALLFFMLRYVIFVFPLLSRQPFLDHQAFIYVNNCRPAPCGGQPAVTSVHLPSLRPPTSPTPGNPLTPRPPPPGLAAQSGERAAGPRAALPAPPLSCSRGFGGSEAARPRQSWLCSFVFIFHSSATCLW